MAHFHHDGVTIRYERQGDGPAVVFLHNGGTSSTIWRHQVADLSRHYRTVAVDLPGFGRSPRPPRPPGLQELVDLTAALIRAEHLAPVLAVGNCMGSNIAAGVAREHPELVAALVLVNPLTEATFAAGTLGPLHRMSRVVPRTTRVARALTRRVVLPRLAAQAVVRFQVGAAGVRAGVHRDPELIACGRRPEQLPALIDVLDDMASYGRLDRAPADLPGVPRCVIWGASNRVLSPGAGAVLNERLDPERVETLARCGHLPMLEDHAAVTRIIAEFAERHLPAPAATTQEHGSAQ